ncbi:GerAB/ArcD/ProY family transporter [Neobacillus drentensis]|uniref:GerAB/ArcD/ProY family transporter n=1 Tax=Neobacillus drentensis TaxID=220684 RepID=UPI002FFD718A
MEQVKINGFQFFCMIFLFELGSAILIGMAAEARQDAWISVIMGIGFGCMLYLIFTKLSTIYPSLPLTKYLRNILGRYLGWLIGLLYVTYFLYIASRVLRDFEELLVITGYRNSSLLTVGIIMMVCVMYAVYKGLEVFFRISELCLFLIVFLFLLLIFFEIASGIVKINHLLPILEYGWKPVFKTFPSALTIPFGEMITFTTLLPYLNKQENAKKVGIIGIALSGFFLLLFTFLNIAIAGADITSRSAFPILTAVSYINIADFIQRLDTVLIISMVILGFVKITVFFFCALIGIADLFKIEEPKKMIYPVGIIILISSIIIAPSYIEHIYEGVKLVPYILHIPLQIVIPTILLIIAIIKQKGNQQTQL